MGGGGGGGSGRLCPQNAKKRAPETRHRLQCKSLFNIADLVNGMWKVAPENENLIFGDLWPFDLYRKCRWRRPPLPSQLAPIIHLSQWGVDWGAESYGGQLEWCKETTANSARTGRCRCIHILIESPKACESHTNEYSVKIIRQLLH